jgi:hypothetical protein
MKNDAVDRVVAAGSPAETPAQHDRPLRLAIEVREYGTGHGVLG